MLMQQPYLWIVEDSSKNATAAPERRRKQDMLKMYYGSTNGASNPSTDPYDINGASFQPDTYLNRMLKEKGLTDLMDKEMEMTRQIKLLDSDMQTLVYENYNKFISATDTIRKVITVLRYLQLRSQLIY